MIGLDSYCVEILEALERLRMRYLWVPEGVLLKILQKRYKESFLAKKLDFLEKYELIKFRYSRQSNQYMIRITSKGFDHLVLWELIKGGYIDRICSEVGTGKESFLYSAIKNNEWRIAKFHRFYGAPFKDIKKSAAFAAISREVHYEEVEIPRRRAENEYRILNALKGLNVPKVYARIKHGLLMNLIGKDGLPAPELSEVDLKNPKDALNIILEDYREFINRGIIHGDLSEFNILVYEGDLYYIDWPQAVSIENPAAKELLERDIRNILGYFKREYDIKVSEGEIVEKFLKEI